MAVHRKSANATTYINPQRGYHAAAGHPGATRSATDGSWWERKRSRRVQCDALQVSHCRRTGKTEKFSVKGKPSGGYANLTFHPADSQLALSSTKARLKPAVEEELRKTMSKRNLKSSTWSRKTKSREQESELDRLKTKPASVRNMKALRGSREEKALLQRYTRELMRKRNAGRLRKEISTLKCEARRAAGGA